MRSRLVATLVLTTTAVITAIGLAIPAQAGLPGYVKYGSYGWNEQCLNIGYTGQANHTWHYYYCETVGASTWDAPGLYNLWVAY
jgi:hypothetical protein